MRPRPIIGLTLAPLVLVGLLASCGGSSGSNTSKRVAGSSGATGATSNTTGPSSGGASGATGATAAPGRRGSKESRKHRRASQPGPSGATGGSAAQGKKKSSGKKKSAATTTPNRGTTGHAIQLTGQPDQLYVQSKEVCQILTLKGLAKEYNVAKTPKAVATAYARSYAPEVRRAVYRGCKAAFAKG